MRLTEAAPWMQQYEALRQRKLGVEPEEGAARPKAWQNNLAGKKTGNVFQQGLSLADMLEAALPGGIGGLGEDYAIDATGRKAPSEAVSKQLAQIGNKLKSGKALSDREMKLLEKYSPDLYQEAKQIEAERKQYEQELSNCRSKEDVQRLKMSKLSQYSAEIQAVSRSNMSKEDKAAAIEAIGHRMTNTQKVYQEFVESGAYDALPDKCPELEPKDKEEVQLPEEKPPEAEEAAKPEEPAEAPAETETKVEVQPDGTVAETEVPVQPEAKAADPVQPQAKAADGKAAEKAPRAAAPQGQGAKESAKTYGPAGGASKPREDEPLFFSITI